MNQVLSEDYSMTNPDNYDGMNYNKRTLMVRRQSLIQQAAALEQQRRAILSEIGEIEKDLKKLEGG